MTLADLELFDEAPVDAVLTSYCVAATADVAAIHDVAPRWFRNWLVDTFITESGDLAELRDDERGTTPVTTLRALEDRYLLRAYPGSRIYRLISGRLVEPLRQMARAGEVQLDWNLGGPAEYLRAGERARIAGEYELAEGLARLTLRTGPGSDLRLHADAWSLIGDVAYERGQFDDAERSYRSALELFQVRRQDVAVGRLFAAIARTLVARGRLAEALTQLSAAVNRSSDPALRDELELIMALSQQAQGRVAFGDD